MTIMNDAELEILLDKAAKRGAAQALRDIGLSDAEAYDDMKELRSLLDVWRDTRRTVGQTIARAFTMGILGLIVVGVYFEFGGK
jgi:hypothetical protein